MRGLLEGIEWSIEAAFTIHVLSITTLHVHQRSALLITLDMLAFRRAEVATKIDIFFVIFPQPHSPKSHHPAHLQLGLIGCFFGEVNDLHWFHTLLIPCIMFAFPCEKTFPLHA